MRELKFRAWTGKEMIYMSLEDLCIHFAVREENMEDCIEPSPNLDCNEYKFAEQLGYKETYIMQYTSLKDKNGKEIYEGDILNVTTPDNSDYDWNNTIYKVQYDDFGYEAIDKLGRAWDFYLLDSESIDIEVVGNIYENPDLIKSD